MEISAAPQDEQARASFPITEVVNVPPMSREELFARIQVCQADALKPETALGGQPIHYLPEYFNDSQRPLKETSIIVPATGPNGEKLAYLVKPNNRVIIDVTRFCGALCGACINNMYEQTMPPEYYGNENKVNTVRRGSREAETLTRLRAFVQLNEAYFNQAHQAMGFSVERCHTRAITLTGGEPTNIGPNLLHLLDVVGPKAYPDINDIKLFTHGGLLLNTFPKWEDPKQKCEQNVLNELIDRGVTQITISRHHANDEANNAYMGDVAPNREQIAEIVRQAKERGIFVRMSSLVQKGVIEDTRTIFEYLQFAKEVGADAVIFRALAMSEALTDEEKARTSAIDTWVNTHRIGFNVVQEMMEEVPGIHMGQLVDQKIKTRRGFVWQDMPVTLEGKHDPQTLETDIGVLTMFPQKEGVDFTYRWIHPEEHRVHFAGPDWTKDEQGNQLPYFRDPKPKHVREKNMFENMPIDQNDAKIVQ